MSVDKEPVKFWNDFQSRIDGVTKNAQILGNQLVIARAEAQRLRNVLVTVHARIAGSVAADWVDDQRYNGTLADYIKTEIERCIK